MRRLLYNIQNDRSKISKIQNIYVDERKGKRMFILAWTLCGVDIRRRGAYCSSTFLSELNHHNTYVYLVIVLNAEKNPTWVYKSISTLILVYDWTLSSSSEKITLEFVEGHPIFFKIAQLNENRFWEFNFT